MILKSPEASPVLGDSQLDPNLMQVLNVSDFKNTLTGTIQCSIRSLVQEALAPLVKKLQHINNKVEANAKFIGNLQVRVSQISTDCMFIKTRF